MPPQRAVNIVEKVAAALDFAHRHHIVHRDVKPANILLTVGDDGDQERVYLTDFGVAKAMGGIEAQATALTTAGNVVATLDFAAPEQIEGQSLDGRCDVYALGCVLYKLLTGAIPYPGENLGAKVYARMHRPPPAPAATNATVPPAFDRVVATALALDPDDRCQTGRALAVAARSAISGGPGNSPSTQGVSRGDSSATEYPGTSGRRVLLAATGRSAFPEGRRPGPAGPAGGSRPTIEGPSERHPEALPDNTSGFALDVGDPADDPAERLPPDLAQLSAPGLQKGSGAGPTRPSSGGRARRRSTVAFGCVLVPALLITVISLVQRGGVAGTPALRAAASATLPTTAASPGGQPTATSSGTTKSATSSGGTRTSAAGIRPVVGLPHSRPLGANIVVVSRGYGSKFALCPLDAQTGKVGNPIFAPRDYAQNPLIPLERGSLIYLQGDQSGNTVRTVAPDGSGDRLLFGRPPDCPAIGRPAWNPSDAQQLAISCTSGAGKPISGWSHCKVSWSGVSRPSWRRSTTCRSHEGVVVTVDGLPCHPSDFITRPSRSAVTEALRSGCGRTDCAQSSGCRPTLSANGCKSDDDRTVTAPNVDRRVMGDSVPQAWQYPQICRRGNTRRFVLGPRRQRLKGRSDHGR